LLLIDYKNGKESDKMQELSKKILLINLLISQFFVLGVGVILYWFLRIRKGAEWFDLFAVSIDKLIIYSVIGTIILVIMQFVFIKFVSLERLFDDANRQIFEKFTYLELLFIFLFGAIAEEFLFRGVIQPAIGIWLTSVVFMLVHVRYLKKIYIMLEVLLLSLLLGWIYLASGSFWPAAVSHFFVNYIMAVLAKCGYFPLPDNIQQ